MMSKTHDSKVNVPLLRISVAILAYNAEKYIRDAVTSIINQDYPGEIEIVIAYDKGSTDKTLQILDEIKESLPPHRKIVIFQHEHTTPFRARVYCLEKFTGDYVHLFDYDNIMPPDRISKVVEHIRRTGSEFLFSNAKVIDANGHDTGRTLVSIKNLYDILRLIRGNFVDINTIVISQQCAKKLKNILTKLRHRFFDWIFEDWLLALLAMKHCNVHYMNDTVILYRIHEENITAIPSFLTRLFNIERTLKTLVAFYALEHNNLSVLEKIELLKCIFRRLLSLLKKLALIIATVEMKIIYSAEEADRL